jgi:flagellar basal-body rod modification protein FlgD
MTTTSAVTNASATSALSSTNDASSAQSIEDQFLKLLTTQLQNQDPTNPMDNMQLTSQLAQISTVEGITNLNTTLQSISSQMDLSQSIDATSFIGKSVLVQGNSILLGTDSTSGSTVTTPFGINLTSDAANVQVKITDANGTVVNTVNLGKTKAGVYSYDWDGKSSTGAASSNGSYSFTVTATDANGNAVTVNPLTYGLVGSVAYTSSGPVLNLGTAGTTTLAGVYKVFSTADDSSSI